MLHAIFAIQKRKDESATDKGERNLESIFRGMAFVSLSGTPHETKRYSPTISVI